MRRFNSIRNSLSISISIVTPGRSRPLSSDFSAREYAKVLLRFPVLRSRKWRLAKTRERPFFFPLSTFPFLLQAHPALQRDLFPYPSPLVSSPSSSLSVSLFPSPFFSFSFPFVSPALCRQHSVCRKPKPIYLPTLAVFFIRVWISFPVRYVKPLGDIFSRRSRKKKPNISWRQIVIGACTTGTIPLSTRSRSLVVGERIRRGWLSRIRDNGKGDSLRLLGSSSSSSSTMTLGRIRRHGEKATLEKHSIDLSLSLLQRRHGRAALLPALEQLPVEHDVRVSSAPADRSLRRRHPGMQRGLVKGA